MNKFLLVVAYVVTVLSQGAVALAVNVGQVEVAALFTCANLTMVVCLVIATQCGVQVAETKAEQKAMPLYTDSVLRAVARTLAEKQQLNKKGGA